MHRYPERRDRLVRKLTKAKVSVPAFLVTDFTNVTYLTGFTGDDSYLLLGPGLTILISDGRYTTQLAEECPGLETYIRKTGEKMPEAVAKVVKRAHLSKVGFESNSMTVAQRDEIAEKLPKVELVPVKDSVEELRETKDAGELAEIREAVRYAEKAFAMLRARLRPSDTEKQVVDQLEHDLRQVGSKCASFPPIVAVGARAALPHAPPTNKRIDEADFVLVDWGASGRLYKSDLTRVLVTGRISPKLERVYGVVLKAQERAIAKIRAGVPARDVDAEARSSIEKAGFGRFFNHSLGHGLGLRVHEGPSLRSTTEEPLRAGMVVTVEPGVYIPGWGGVRIEDDVLVTRTGCEVLSNVPKRLQDMVVA